MNMFHPQHLFSKVFGKHKNIIKNKCKPKAQSDAPLLSLLSAVTIPALTLINLLNFLFHNFPPTNSRTCCGNEDILTNLFPNKVKYLLFSSKQSFVAFHVKFIFLCAGCNKYLNNGISISQRQR